MNGDLICLIREPCQELVSRNLARIRTMGNSCLERAERKRGEDMITALLKKLEQALKRAIPWVSSMKVAIDAARAKAEVRCRCGCCVTGNYFIFTITIFTITLTFQPNSSDIFFFNDLRDNPWSQMTSLSLPRCLLWLFGA